MNPDGSDQFNVTHDNASDSQPVWFSLLNGQLKIAFTTNRDDGYHPQIYSVFPDGTDISLFRLTNNTPITSDWTRGYWSGPGVTSNDATNIASNSATLKGNLDSLGSAQSSGNPVSVSFVVGKVPGSYPRTTPAQTMTATVVFSYDLSNLDEGTTYYYRAQAIGDGMNYGAEKSFTTNRRPVLGTLKLPVDPVAVKTVVNGSATFTDLDLADTHTGVWDWGDGSTSAATINENNGNGMVTGIHTYTEAGVYEVKLTLTDHPGGASVESVFRYVVVYNPGGGFVTGGGWIDSPAGAYSADTALTGKATFGFVAKYQKGANVPTGQTEFQFHVANFNFHSESYDWLVVAGAKAQYKGIGTINGSGEYFFMLSAIDGQLSGGGGVDKFRIKIWDKKTGNIIYDNQMGKDENGDFATEIQGGSIVIHK